MYWVYTILPGSARSWPYNYSCLRGAKKNNNKNYTHTYPLLAFFLSGDGSVSFTGSSYSISSLTHLTYKAYLVLLHFALLGFTGVAFFFLNKLKATPPTTIKMTCFIAILNCGGLEPVPYYLWVCPDSDLTPPLADLIQNRNSSRPTCRWIPKLFLKNILLS